MVIQPEVETIDVTVETLLGTSYEVRVSTKTNVGFLKAKLQRTEGIPMQYLHLVHRGKGTPKRMAKGDLLLILFL